MELSRDRQGGFKRQVARRMLPCRVSYLGVALLAVTQLTVAPLPDAEEYSRVKGCFQINGYIDFTAPATRPEDLPPCLATCPPGTEVVANQCVWPSLDQEELRLRFELFERCQPDSCQFLNQWDSHIKVVGMKISQFLGVPTSELKEAMIFWSTTTWPLPEGSPRLQKFLISRRGEEDFPHRRTSTASSERWYLLHMTFRIDSSRISRWYRPVRQLIAEESRSLSAFLGTEVEVQRPKAETNEERTGNTYSHADYQIVYQFEGHGPNQNPFQGATTTQQAQEDPCRDSCYVVDEQVHRLGAHRCDANCDCTGERTCTGHGYCVGKEGVCRPTTGPTPSPQASTQGGSPVQEGNSAPSDATTSSTTTTTKTPIVVPGYECILRNAGVPEVHGARTPVTTLLGCARKCTSAPTCRALEWHAPDYCFLITQSLSSSAFQYGNEDGIWYVCGRIPSSRTTTITARATAPTTTIEATSTSRPRVSALYVRQEIADEDVPDGPGWYPWLAAVAVPMLCCSCLALKLFVGRRQSTMHKVHSFSDQQEYRERNIRAARGWAMATDSQGAAGTMPATASAFGYSETLRPENWAQTAAPQSPSEATSRAKSWSESVRSPLSQFRRTRPLFADEEKKPQSEPQKPRRYRSAPSSSSAFNGAGDADGTGSPRGPMPHFSTAWEGSYGAHGSRSRDSFAAQSGPRGAADAATDESSMPAGHAPSHCRTFRSSRSSPAAGSASAHGADTNAGSRRSESADAGRAAAPGGSHRTPRWSKSRVAAGQGDTEGRRRSKSAEAAGFGDHQSRWRSKSSDAGGRASGRARSPRTPSPGTPRPTPPPTPRGSAPPPPPSWQESQRSRSEQLAEELSNNNADTPRDALSPVALALELAKLRESTLAVRRRYFMAQCLRWHPDKNAGDEQHATRMFQVLQEKKEWFLSDR